MKKSLLIALALMLAAVSLFACSGKQGSSPPAGDEAGNAPAADDMKEKLKIDLMSIAYQGGGWSNNNEIINKLNEKLNIELNIQWVPTASYAEKMNVLAASNTFPDVFFFNDSTNYIKWQDKGIFLELGQFKGDYPDLFAKVDQDQLKLLNPQDKIYGIPWYIPTFRDSLGLRKDWLTKLNLQTPNTIEEFYAVAKAFVENDPDGNGKKDTIGFSTVVNKTGGFLNNFAHITAAFGLANDWMLQDGNLVPMEVQTDELKKMMEFLNKAYQEGVLDRDFLINKNLDDVEKYRAGKLGIYYANSTGMFNLDLKAVRQAQPGAEIAAIAPPEGPDGKRGMGMQYGGAKVVVNAKIDSKKQQRILKLLEYMVSDGGADLLKNGIEGVHYKKEGDKFVQLEALEKERPYLLYRWFMHPKDNLYISTKADDPSIQEQISQAMNENSKYPYPNAGYGLVSETYQKIGVNLKNKWNETMIKVIIGELPLSAVDQAVAEWKKNGGDKIIEETNAMYASRK